MQVAQLRRHSSSAREIMERMKKLKSGEWVNDKAYNLVVSIQIFLINFIFCSLLFFIVKNDIQLYFAGTISSKAGRGHIACLEGGCYFW